MAIIISLHGNRGFSHRACDLLIRFGYISQEKNKQDLAQSSGWLVYIIQMWGFFAWFFEYLVSQFDEV